MIQVVIQILMAGGSVFGTKLNCAVLALMDVMKGLTVACTCVVVEGENGCNCFCFCMDYCRFFPRAKLISLETYGFDWQLG
jgi:hypothetical protein